MFNKKKNKMYLFKKILKNKQPSRKIDIKKQFNNINNCF